MWTSLALFLTVSLATAATVLFACPVQYFGAGVVAMVGTGLATMLAREIHQGQQLTVRPAVDPSEDLFPKK